jgi:hypothetical protein
VLTLSSLLLPPEAELAASITRALDDDGVSMAAGGGPHLSVSAFRLMAGALAQQLPGLLNIGLADVFVGAWNKSVAVRQQIDKSAKAPGKDQFLQLAEHKITSTHKPYVALMKGGRELARVPFEVSVEIVMQGAMLRILDGAIQEIQTGRVKGKGTVKCAGAILVDKEIQPVQIPGTIAVPPPETVDAFFGPRGNRRAAPAVQPAQSAEVAADVRLR